MSTSVSASESLVDSLALTDADADLLVLKETLVDSESDSRTDSLNSSDSDSLTDIDS